MEPFRVKAGVYRLALYCFVHLLCSSLRAQPWEPAASGSFGALASAEDGALLLLRYPGDILRSTDTGATWSVVYRAGFRVSGFGYSGEGNAIWAVGDNSEAVVSYDSGRSWQGGPPPSPLLLRFAPQEGEFAILPFTLYPLPSGVHAAAFADSAYWAVGEPGLICRWDGTKWREVHRAPFGDNPGTTLQPTTPQPPPTPLRSAGGGVQDEGKACIAFSSAAHGAIAVGNRMYFTNDSAVTWSQLIVPDTASISCMFLLSDTSALVGMRDGQLYYNSHNALTRCDSIFNSGEKWGGWESQPLQTIHPILEIGWKDKLDGDLFVLTDSLLYSVRSDLSSTTTYALPLASGEHAVAASFPDTYTGFLLADSTRTQDTLASDGRDTMLEFDTCKIYRSLDGGATWNVALKNIPSLTNLYFENTKVGFVCGANGLIMHTEDTGVRWSRAWTNSRQHLHDINFVNETTGYAVGDSGVVLLTQTSGRFWRPMPPEPLFMHPAIAYTRVAFSDEHTVYIVANDRCYKASIPRPLNFHSHWHFPERHTLSITERPNPSSGAVEFDIRSTSANGFIPALKICDVSGTPLSDVSGIESISSGEWTAQTDLSSLSPGVYTAIVTLGSEQAMCKFLIER